jgi:hypothetical protein
MNGWQEFLQPVLTEITRSLAPAIPAIAQGWAMSQARHAQTNGGPPPTAAISAPAMNPAAAMPAATNDPRQMVTQFLDEIWRPMRNHLSMVRPPHNEDPTETGKEFAAWVYDGYSADPRYDTAVNAARMAGIGLVVDLYRQSPYWAG